MGWPYVKQPGTDIDTVVAAFPVKNLQELWTTLGCNSAKMFVDPFKSALRIPDHDRKRIIVEADNAIEGKFSFLGHDFDIELTNIHWNKDYSSGKIWLNAYCHDIQVNCLDEACDVKLPWELSRLQWLIPVVQAYALTGEEKYAHCIKRVILDWINKNPLAQSLNWSCTMDVAIRAISLCWFIRVLGKSRSWDDAEFQSRLVANLYDHGRFIIRNLEYSDVSGNHLTSDAAGLVFLANLFSGSVESNKWFRCGWKILETEIVKQTSVDGVNFEASIPYHRLALEIFLYPALVSKEFGHQPSPQYKTLLVKMAEYIAAYTRPDGSVPLLGDGDDGRILPFRMQPMNDHRYLLPITASYCKSDIPSSSEPDLAEYYWWLSEKPLTELMSLKECMPTARVFEPGYAVLQAGNSHIFVDCAEVGMNGKGGHGHNDCLSFTLMLDGCLLFEDRGCLTYSRDYKKRNEYRSTQSHNIPQFRGKEINRFIAPKMLWNLRSEIEPQALSCVNDSQRLIFKGDLSKRTMDNGALGFKRTIELNLKGLALELKDSFFKQAQSGVVVPFHLAGGVVVRKGLRGGEVIVSKDKKEFLLKYDPSKWLPEIKLSSSAGSYRQTKLVQLLIFVQQGLTDQFHLYLVKNKIK